jgi:beta-lactamase regulating signal transducer with metallopeptidase domain
MNWTQLQDHPLVTALGWTLVHSLWQGAAIAAAFALVQAALRGRSPNARYLAGCATLVLLISACVGMLTYQLATIHAPGIASTPPTTPAPSRYPSTIPPRPLPPRIDEPRSALLPSSDAPLTTSESLASTALLHARRAIPWAVPAWAIGVLLLSLRNLGGWLRAQRLRRAGVRELSAAWRDRLATLAATLGIKRPVALLESTLIQTPSLIGHLRPVILLPASVLTGLTPHQIEAVLLHELAHVRRHDYLVNLLQSVIEVLLFYHPAVWWISAAIRREREHCCDDIAAEARGDRVAYARDLLALEELRGGTFSPALGASGHLRDRVFRLLGKHRPQPATGWLAAPTAALMVLAVLACWPSRPATVPSAVAEAATQPAARAVNPKAKNWPGAFNELIPANFQANKLSDIVDYFHNTTGVGFVPNWRKLEAQGADRETPVTLSLNNVPASVALRLLLEQLNDNVGFSVDEGVVEITTGLTPRFPAEIPDDPAVNAAVAKQLEAPVLTNFQANKLDNVIAYFRNTTGLNFFVHWRKLEIEGVGTDSPVTLQLAQVPARKALELLLELLSDNLTLEIRHGVVVISTKPAAPTTQPPALRTYRNEAAPAADPLKTAVAKAETDVELAKLEIERIQALIDRNAAGEADLNRANLSLALARSHLAELRGDAAEFRGALVDIVKAREIELAHVERMAERQAASAHEVQRARVLLEAARKLQGGSGGVVYLGGGVGRPGTYGLPADGVLTLRQLLASAGYQPTGRRQAEVYRTDAHHLMVAVATLKDDDERALGEVILGHDDLVLVVDEKPAQPPAHAGADGGSNVYVRGVTRPGTYQLADGLTLTKLLIAAGTDLTKGDLNVTIIRQIRGGGEETTRGIRTRAILRGATPDVRLWPNDTIEVKPAASAPAPPATQAAPGAASSFSDPEVVAAIVRTANDDAAFRAELIRTYTTRLLELQKAVDEHVTYWKRTESHPQVRQLRERIAQAKKDLELLR